MIMVLVLGGCVSAPPPPKPKLNPLQIQAMQTRDFEATKRPVFNAVMTTLQNEGYTVEAANYDTGFITAKSTTRNTPFSTVEGTSDSDLNAPPPKQHASTGEKVAIGAAVAAIAAGAIIASHHGSNGVGFNEVVVGGPVISSGSNQNSGPVLYSITVSALVTEKQNVKTPFTNVRISFVQHKTIPNQGGQTKDTQILDANFYQKVFNGIRQQVFVGQAMQ